MKKSVLFLFLVALFFLIGPEKSFASFTVNAYLFYGEGCPHCVAERQFLDQIKKQFLNEEKFPDKEFEFYEFEIYHNHENALLMQKIAQTLQADASGVPFLIIGDKPFIGYGSGVTDTEIENQIKECLQNNCPDSVAKIIGMETKEKNNSNDPVKNEEVINDQKEKVVSLPILGKINVANFSLPILAIIMGALDGFNPCAMWVLLFLISLLLGIENKKRRWILGSAFIVASASVYFIFMSAWLNLILFIGFVVWVKILIGLLALGGGVYNIKEFIFNKESGCKVAGDKKRQRIFEKLKLATGQRNFILALGGIITLAFMVNLVELVCSAGLPAVFTQVLTMNNLANWQYYFYILLYIFFFMLDDLFIFFVAMITLEMTGITTKYARYSRLIGGSVMFLIGLALLFKPELLMFG